MIEAELNQIGATAKVPSQREGGTPDSEPSNLPEVDFQTWCKMFGPSLKLRTRVDTASSEQLTPERLARLSQMILRMSPIEAAGYSGSLLLELGVQYPNTYLGNCEKLGQELINRLLQREGGNADAVVHLSPLGVSALNAARVYEDRIAVGLAVRAAAAHLFLSNLAWEFPSTGGGKE